MAATHKKAPKGARIHKGRLQKMLLLAQNPFKTCSPMPPATCDTHSATNLLTATPVEAALIIACALTDPKDLLRLARACRRFAIKCIAAPAVHRTAASGGGTAAAAQQLEMCSIAEEVARRWIADCTDQERGWVPRRGRESWLGLMWEVQSLRRGAAMFGRSHELITLSEGGTRATVSSAIQFSYRAAASKMVMRAGRHYVQFTVMSDDLFFGAIRPGWDVEGGQDAFHVDGHCFYLTYTGTHGARYPGLRHWEGMQGAKQGDRIGMLLDLDQGSMTVYKNDERLGVLATGLSGEYSWAVTLGYQGASARIESAPAPASPTAEELAQAVAYEAEQADDN
jgi:hypothetical protein